MIVLQEGVGITYHDIHTYETDSIQCWFYLPGPPDTKQMNCVEVSGSTRILIWNVVPWGISSGHNISADSRFAPSQWETVLLCNDVSHWLGASLESAPQYYNQCIWFQTHFVDRKLFHFDRYFLDFLSIRLSQHWYTISVGTIRQQAITCTKYDDADEASMS